jgi:adenylate cyclase
VVGDGSSRRLAAILAADVVGFSHMMEANEAGTLAELKRHREAIFYPAVAGHNGRIVKLIGDGTLVEFGSVVDAVNCALAVQSAVAAADASPGVKIVLRIGINLGDVIIEGDDIYGDGVNVAARLEPLAEPGGVCIASIVHECLGNRIDAAFRDGGEIRVKNIERPVRVWKWHPSASAASEARVEAVMPKAREGPSIAVLPFQNLSGDREQEYFSDGITEDVITDLSKVGGLLVIARNSSFAYKGKAVDMRVIARELGVRSVLEGSIRRAGNRVRITAQLIDAENGGHLWADRFDGDMSDMFALQDEITRQIVDALKVKLSPGEAAKLAGSEPTNSKAHDYFLLGREVLFGPIKNREVFERSTDLFEQAIAEDPSYGEPHAGIAMAEFLNFQNHWTDDWSRSLEKAEHHLGLALHKSPEVAFVHFVASVFFMWKKDLDRCAAEADAALDLNPNHGQAHNMRGIVSIYGGKPLDAVPHIERAMRLDPLSRQQYIHFLGSAYLVAGRYEAAVALFRERIRLAPKTDLSRAFLAVALGHLGETDEAQRVWRELMEINPQYSFAEHVGRLPFRHQADIDCLSEGLGKAGIPASPPSSAAAATS